MFEAAELGAKVDKKTWSAEAPRLRGRLLAAQHRLAVSDKSCVIVIGGAEAAGKRESANLLLEWLDTRGVQAHTLRDRTDEERTRPELYRFWRRLPAAGRVGIFLGSWYTRPTLDRTFHRLGEGAFERELDRIVELERMLVSENVLLVKLWLHLAKKQQKKRLLALEADEATGYRVTADDWKLFHKADRFRKVAEHALRKTSTGEAPWTVIESTDARHRSLSVARAVLTSIEEGLGAPRRAPRRQRAPRRPPSPDQLGALDLSKTLSKAKYERKMPALQARIGVATRRLEREGRSLVLVFEGPDAAGKGSAIRRITPAIDAGLFQVIPVSAPTDEELAHPYLWRFWRTIPRLGHVGIFDRSWYGRVLVERVEGLARPDEWQRAWAELNAFEEQLVEGGAILLKFWLAVSQEEQLRRFEARERTPYKQYKITEEDWRNREKWAAYARAANEMFERTSTEHAPWTLVPANDKLYARHRVLATVADALDDALS